MSRVRVKGALLVLATIILAACDAQQPLLSPLSDEGVVLAFGNSLTYGSGATELEAYPRVLEHLISREVINAGIPGETAQQGARRLPRELDRYRPDLVILCEGGNDMLRGRSDEAIRRDLEAMVTTCLDRDIDVILLGVPRPKILSSVPQFYEDLARQYNVAYEGDILERVLTNASLKSDVIHPNAAGYRAVALSLQDLLQSKGALAKGLQ